MLRIILWGVSALLVGGASLEQSKPRPSASPTPAASATAAPDEQLDRPTSDPYTGSLSIFEDPKRAEKLQIERVMDILAIREGSVVADIGAGSGWFTVRAARRVGPPGIVYAVEINEDYVNHIRSRAEKEDLANVRAVLGREDDPLLPPASVDSILLLKTYHEFSKPISMLRTMRKAMRKDALLGIIDRNGAGDDHGVKSDEVKKEASKAGFVFVAEYDFVRPDKMDYFLVFRNANGALD
jgi:predicted methyltransferase